MTLRDDALPLFAEAAPPQAIASPPIELKLNELLAVPDEQYNADQTAVRKTWLDQIERSPAHLQAYRAGLVEPTEAMAFGQLLHCFVLEADMIDSRYYRQPEVDRRTKAGKDIAAETAAKNPGKRGFKAADFDLGLRLRDAVYAHRSARIVLGCDGGFEQSLFWRNADTDLLCKARYDKVSVAKAFVADIKSTQNASPHEFAKAVVNYRYDVSAAHYTEPNGLRFVMIAVEKSFPFCVAVYAVDDAMLKLGKRRRLPNLRRYAECSARDEWPGYDDRINHLTLPQWAFR